MEAQVAIRVLCICAVWQFLINDIPNERPELIQFNVSRNSTLSNSAFRGYMQPLLELLYFDSLSLMQACLLQAQLAFTIE